VLSKNHKILVFFLGMLRRSPVRELAALVGTYLAYPIAELIEKRAVLEKFRKLRKFYKLSFEQRSMINKHRLVQVLSHAQLSVPYYKDLFSSIKFNPENCLRDPKYLQDLPLLTKEIIEEQGERLLAKKLTDVRYQKCRTGGSTGPAINIFYDQHAVDWSSAVTLFCRDSIGKRRRFREVHFASNLPNTPQLTWPNREDLKCFAMNRGNIFFDNISDLDLARMYEEIALHRPFLVHAHPSTIALLAHQVSPAHKGVESLFDVFESSGELLTEKARKAISTAFGCRVVNRYGLAEFGVVAYELGREGNKHMVLDSEVWPETYEQNGVNELILTGYRNYLMPLIRYRTGDIADLKMSASGIYLDGLFGRVHGVFDLNGQRYFTHHVMDVLDHRIGGINEFQIDIRSDIPVLRIVLDAGADENVVRDRVFKHFGSTFQIDIVLRENLIYVGHRAKFSHLVK
jgi:phenylacetate-CoA ligase